MQTSPADRVAGEVRAEMARQRVTQAELARRIQRNQQWLSRRLGEGREGGVEFTVSDLDSIARALGVEIGKFLPASAVA